MKNVNRMMGIVLAAAAFIATTGCGSVDLSGLDDVLANINVEITSATGSDNFQDRVDVNVPDVVEVDLESQGDTIIVNNDVDVIVNIEQDIVVAELPDSLLLGLENQTGTDIYIRYFVDGERQGVFIFDGEILLLDYPCIDELIIDSEEDFDTLTGENIDSFTYGDEAFFTRPENFDCGDFFLVTFDPGGLTASPESIDLLD